jgi:hypothetical protein
MDKSNILDSTARPLDVRKVIVLLQNAEKMLGYLTSTPLQDNKAYVGSTALK